MSSDSYSLEAATMVDLRRRRAATVIIIVVSVVAAANALAFAWHASNPLVSSDAWYFARTYLQKALDGTVGIADLLARRGALDHSQPLNKLFLMFNARYLGLDFRYEAIAGWFGIVAGMTCLWWVAATTWDDRAKTLEYGIAVAALGGIYFSLNSSMLFTWPLVTFGQVTSALNLMLFMLAWRAWTKGRFTGLAIAVLLSCVMGDTSAILASCALVLAFCWVGGRQGSLEMSVRAVGACMFAMALYKLGSLFLLPAVPEGSTGASLRTLLSKLLAGDPRDLLVPFHAGLVQNGQLAHFFPSTWGVMRIAIGLLLLLAHIWFWKQAWKRRVDMASFVAVTMMLLFYGYVAGIFIGRIGRYGLSYLNEPRYPLVYQVGVLALILMTLSDPGRRKIGEARMATAACLAVILLQIPLSISSWGEVRYLRNYYQKMAAQMIALARNPATNPADCVANLTICGWDSTSKTQVVGMLMRYQLNLYSTKFRERHHLAD